MAKAKIITTTPTADAAGDSLTLGEAIDLAPEAIQAGRDLGNLGQAIKFALDPNGDGGKRITLAEAKRIGKEAMEAAKAASTLAIQIFLALGRPIAK